MKPQRLLDRAEAELLDAALYYQEQIEGLGSDFLDAMDRAFLDIREAPERWPLVGEGIRRYLVNRFPYSVFYRVDEREVLILAVAHHRRRPWYWL